MSATDRRKVLVPLATLLAAGAVAIGSGATFTSSTVSTTSLASGSVTHANDVTGLDVKNIKPGDVVTGSVTVTNTGTLDSTLTLQEVASTNGFAAQGADLQLTLSSGTTELYSGTFGGLADATVIDLGALPVDGATTVTWTVSLTETVDNSNEGKSASASYEWVSTQEAGDDKGVLARLSGVVTGN